MKEIEMDCKYCGSSFLNLLNDDVYEDMEMLLSGTCDDNEFEDLRVYHSSCERCIQKRG